MTPKTGSGIILTDGASKGQAPKTEGRREAAKWSKMYSKKDAIDRIRMKTIAEYGFDLQLDLGVIMVNHPQSIDLFKPIFPHLVKMRKAALEEIAEIEKRRF